MAYILRWKNPSVNSQKATEISVPVGSIVSDKASLRFTGKGASNYGTVQQENLLWLLENFAGPDSPNNPTVGQIWFDTANSVLRVCTSTTPLIWRSFTGAQVTNVGSDAPTPAVTGDEWIQKTGTASAITYIYTGLGRYPEKDGVIGGWEQTFPNVQIAGGREEFDNAQEMVLKLIGDTTTGGNGAYGKLITNLTNLALLDQSLQTKWAELIKKDDNVLVPSTAPVNMLRMEPNSGDWDKLLAAAKYAVSRLELPQNFYSNVSEFPFVSDGRQVPTSLTSLSESDVRFPSLERRSNRKIGLISQFKLFTETMNVLNAAMQNQYSIKGINGASGTNISFNDYVTQRKHAAFNGTYSNSKTASLTLALTFASAEAKRSFINAGNAIQVNLNFVPALSSGGTTVKQYQQPLSGTGSFSIPAGSTSVSLVGKGAAGKSSSAVRTVDGSTWSKSTVPTFTSVAYGNDRFLALSGQDVYSSTDAKTWAKIYTFNPNAASSDYLQARKIAFNNSRFIVILVNISSTAYYNDSVTTSIDGLSWTTPNKVFGGARRLLTNNNGTMIFGELPNHNDNGYAASAVYSANSAFFASETDQNSYDYTNSLYRLNPPLGPTVSGNGKVFMYSYGNQPYFTSDNKNWSFVNRIDQTIGSVIFGNGKFVALDTDGNSITSTDGFDYSAKKNVGDNGLKKGSTLLGYAGGKYFASLDNDIAYSNDGLNWVRATLQGSSAAPNTFSYGQNRLVTTSGANGFVSEDSYAAGTVTQGANTTARANSSTYTYNGSSTTNAPAERTDTLVVAANSPTVVDYTVPDGGTLQVNFSTTSAATESSTSVKTLFDTKGVIRITADKTRVFGSSLPLTLAVAPIDRGVKNVGSEPSVLTSQATDNVNYSIFASQPSAGNTINLVINLTSNIAFSGNLAIRFDVIVDTTTYNAPLITPLYASPNSYNNADKVAGDGNLNYNP
jgi:hypothetical protein